MSPEQAATAAAEAFAAVGASHCRVDTRRNPMMHTTRSIDYVVVLKGRVTLLLDADEAELSPFDVVCAGPITIGSTTALSPPFYWACSSTHDSEVEA